jgi:hypothetical protein
MYVTVLTPLRIKRTRKTYHGDVVHDEGGMFPQALKAVCIGTKQGSNPLLSL